MITLTYTTTTTTTTTNNNNNDNNRHQVLLIPRLMSMLLTTHIAYHNYPDVYFPNSTTSWDTYDDTMKQQKDHNTIGL